LSKYGSGFECPYENVMTIGTFSVDVHADDARFFERIGSKTGYQGGFR
jgi:hypothetical protein